MTAEEIIAFMTFSIVAAITPGPSNIMVTATGAAVGFWRGLPCLLGVGIGMASLMFSVAIGLGQILLSHKSITLVMNWLGAAFLLWLSWKIATADTTATTKEKRAIGFLDAALFQWINQKSWIVSTGAIGAYLHSSSHGLGFQAAIFALLFFLAAVPSLLVWLLFGASLERYLSDQATARIFNRIMGLLLAASTIFILA